MIKKWNQSLIQRKITYFILIVIIENLKFDLFIGILMLFINIINVFLKQVF